MPTTGSRHLLTVVHTGRRTGPPLLALQFLRWLLTERPNWQLTTLFIDEGGPLVDEFAELGRTFVNAPGEDHDLERHPWVASQLRGLRLRRSLARLDKIDLAHIHCVGSMRAVPLLPLAPILCHVHELSVGQDFHLRPAAHKSLPTANRYVAVSDAVRNELLANFDIDPTLDERQRGFVDDALLARSHDGADFDRPSAIRAPGEVVVVSSGVRNWRKAPELFVRTAIRCQQLFPDTRWRFRWIGGADSGGLLEFVGHQTEPLRWIADSDIFLLNAREDAFPLVAVEAAGLGLPIVTFNSGGTPELISHAGCGVVVDFPDVDAVCRTLATLARNSDLRKGLGEAGRTFATENLVLSVAGPRLLATIEATMATG